jgi:hypothetical protein
MGKAQALDGGLRQLVELLPSGHAGMACCLGLEACEHSLVRHPAESSPTTRAVGSISRLGRLYRPPRAMKE